MFALKRRLQRFDRFFHSHAVPRSRLERSMQKIPLFDYGLPVQSDIFAHPLSMGNGEISCAVNIMGALVRNGVICRIRKVYVGLTVRNPQSEMRLPETFDASVQSCPESKEPMGSRVVIGEGCPLRGFSRYRFYNRFRTGCGPRDPCQ